MLKDGDKIKDGSKNIMAMGMRNQVLSLRVRKLEKWWALLVNRTENSIVPVRSRSVDRK